VTIDPFTIALAVFGSALGFGADALAHRWPAHEQDHRPRARFDWRTAVVVVVGALAFGALGATFGGDLVALVVYVPAFAVLLALLATDLDQRLLPDVLTLPLIVFAAAVLALGISPGLAGKEFGTISGLAAAVIVPVLLLAMDRLIGGDLGFGDVKLSISLGLFFGLSALFYGLVMASLGFALVLILLIALRRITLKSAIPFGPVLIFAAFIAALAA